MKKIISAALLALTFSTSSFAILLNDNAYYYSRMEDTRFFLSITSSLPTMLIDDVVHVDLSSEEALAAIVAGDEQVASIFAAKFDTDVDTVLEAAANMEDISIQAFEAEL